MAKADRDNLDDVRRNILTDYLNSRERHGAGDKINFLVTKECSCCGEAGYVPEHHKYLCVFCWVTAPYFASETYQLFDTKYGHKRPTDGQGLDKVNINMPVGIAGVKEEPNVYSTKEFSARDYTQEELQAMIP